MSRSPLELVVCGSFEQARRAGFDDRGRHRQDQTIVAWWPECQPDRLRAFRFNRVTITDEFARWSWDRNGRGGETVALLRSRIDADAIWMEL